jgi:hypothetical protein
MKLIGEFLKKKNHLGSDAWGSTDENIRKVLSPVEELFEKEFPEYDPYPFGQKSEIALLVRHILIAEALVPEYCNLFKDLTNDELVALAESFNFKNYKKRGRLENILSGKEK